MFLKDKTIFLVFMTLQKAVDPEFLLKSYIRKHVSFLLETQNFYIFELRPLKTQISDKPCTLILLYAFKSLSQGTPIKF